MYFCRNIYNRTSQIINNIQSHGSEVIKSMQQFTSTNEFFTSFLKTDSTSIYQNGIQVSVKGGNVLLNGLNLIPPEKFAAMSLAEKTSFLSTIKTSNVSATNTVSLVDFNFYENMYKISQAIEFIINLYARGVPSNRVINMFSQLASDLSALAMKKLVDLLKWVLEHVPNEVWQQLEAMGIRGSDVVSKVIDFVVESLTDMGQKILADAIEELYKDGVLSVKKCQELLKAFVDNFKKTYEPISNKEKKCTVCGGITFCNE